jgi:hypothetical protein
MNNRKTVLLSAIALLLCIYIVQLVRVGGTSVKNITLKDTPTVYSMKTANGEVSLTCTKDGKWIVGTQNYPANDNLATAIRDAIKNIKILDTVSHSDSEAMLERYGLDTAQAVTVTASDADGKALRTVIIGKESSTGSQTYIKIGSGRDIYLVSGSLKNTFGKSVSDLRNDEVYSVKDEDISHVAVASADGNWELEKSGTPAVWSVASGNKGITLDTEKTASFVSSLATLNVQSWADDNTVLPETGGVTMTLTAADKQISVTLYKIGNGKDDKDDKYLGTSTSIPYKFYLAKYAADKYMKKLDDLKK